MVSDIKQQRQTVDCRLSVAAHTGVIRLTTVKLPIAQLLSCVVTVHASAVLPFFS